MLEGTIVEMTSERVSVSWSHNSMTLMALQSPRQEEEIMHSLMWVKHVIINTLERKARQGMWSH